MKITKKAFIIILLSMSACLCFAKNAVFHSDNYSLSVEYNETLVPGDAVFVRMSITVPKSHKKSTTVNLKSIVVLLKIHHCHIYFCTVYYDSIQP